MKNFTITFVWLTLILFLGFHTQAQENAWSKRYTPQSGNDELMAVLNLWNGDALIAGTFLVAVDSSGNKKWSKAIDYEGYSPRIRCMAATHDSMILLTGRIYFPGNFTSNIFIQKMTTDGEVVWSNAIIAGITSEALSVRETDDHGFIMTGQGSDSSGGPSKISLVRIDSSGNLLWGKIITCSNNGSIGTGVDQTSDGGFMVTGHLMNQPMDNVIFLIKVSSDGDVIWAKRQLDAVGYAYGGDVKTVQDGFLCLYMEDSDVCHLIKTDLSGEMQWVKKYPFYSDGWYSPIRLCRMETGGYVFVTPSSFIPFDPGAMFRINDNGDILWAKYVSSSTIALTQTDNGGILILGSSIGGVAGAPQYLKPFGLSKIDSAGMNNSCTDDFSITASSVNHGLVDLVVTVSSTASMLPLTLVADPYNVVVASGCVEQYTGINESNNGVEIIISPNPSSGVFTIQMNRELGGREINRLEIINSAGNTVVVISNPGSSIDLRNYPSGLYLIRAETKSGPLTKRLILQK